MAESAVFQCTRGGDRRGSELVESLAKKRRFLPTKELRRTCTNKMCFDTGVVVRQGGGGGAHPYEYACHYLSNIDQGRSGSWGFVFFISRSLQSSFQLEVKVSTPLFCGKHSVLHLSKPGEQILLSPSSSCTNA